MAQIGLKKNETPLQVIVANGPGSETLGFFRAICSCEGTSVASNQELCLRELMKDPKHRRTLMMETRDIDMEM